MNRVAERRQRIAQFVGESCKKDILASVGLVQGLRAFGYALFERLVQLDELFLCGLSLVHLNREGVVCGLKFTTLAV